MQVTRPLVGPAVAPIRDVLCPDCPPARTARDLVFAESFWHNALLLVLPFLIALVAGIVILRRLDRGSP